MKHISEIHLQVMSNKYFRYAYIQWRIYIYVLDIFHIFKCDDKEIAKIADQIWSTVVAHVNILTSYVKLTSGVCRFLNHLYQLILSYFLERIDSASACQTKYLVRTHTQIE